jgi:rhodanese-related sulfurtransferase
MVLTAANRPLVIDVRQPEEYREAHIAGTKLIPLGELNKHMQELPKDREIVCVCFGQPQQFRDATTC